MLLLLSLCVLCVLRLFITRITISIHHDRYNQADFYRVVALLIVCCRYVRYAYDIYVVALLMFTICTL